ncbi:MAG: PadR family transcriptional regulator [Rhizomicrobium sp.]
MILRLLSAHEMYGYEIVSAISSKTGGVVTPGEGVVYPLLHALEKEGALKSHRKTVNGRSRVYYKLTRRGEKKLAGLTGDWNALNIAVQKVLHAV